MMPPKRFWSVCMPSGGLPGFPTQPRCRMRCEVDMRRFCCLLLVLGLSIAACHAPQPLPPTSEPSFPVPNEPSAAQVIPPGQVPPDERPPVVTPDISLEPLEKISPVVPSAPVFPVAAEEPFGVVAAVHPLAVGAGMRVLRGGGNAVDAAVAAALTLGVVDGYNSGIGGGCLILVRTSGGELLAIDGRETAPRLADREMFLHNGEADPELSRHGPLAVGTPGALAAYRLLLDKAGTKKLSDLIKPAADLAEQGFLIDGRYADRLRRVAGRLKRDPGSAAIFLDRRGRPWPAGHRLLQPDLAASYRRIAREGIDWFYRGAYARSLDRWMRAHGGVLRFADLADYRPVHRQPIRSGYRGLTIVGFPPPSSGGVLVAEILNILQYFPLARLPAGTRLHLVAEAEKRAFADRAFWLGDADFVPVPRGLLDKGYAAELAAGIDTEMATPVPVAGTPPRAANDLFEHHTTHIAAADRAGNWVAITATLNTSFGAKVVVPGSGIVLNNEMDDFAVAPGVPNSFGLVGAEANSVASGKRPLSSMSPTLVLRGEKPILALGAAGGPTIISQVVQVLINRFDLGMSLSAAVAAPRIHHQWRPDRLRVERRLSLPVRRVLEKAGHRLQTRGTIGVTQAVGRDREGHLRAVIDPRLQAE
ncbi:gamma-glutamyltransferase [Geothermobacter hydrogeniphilus]|uniref:Glutathione hydrolase proenzyme n=2 Tax=Geothermobacter hydrogeniphilus TaxID=1969733 RepID=A0A1X0XT25_9BACT|nr:gamma-glutamyltransferase [Geothermobacter hydrogeniphilus]